MARGKVAAVAGKSEVEAVERHGMDAESLKQGILSHLEFTLGELPKHVDSEWEPYVALALTVRDRLMERWIRTHEAYYEQDAKRVYYLSL
jgi:glycogen phosphorylase